MGIALLPDWLIKTEVANGQLVILFEDYEVTDTDFNGAVWMLYPSRDYLPVKVKVFKDFLLEKFDVESAKT